MVSLFLHKENRGTIGISGLFQLHRICHPPAKKTEKIIQLIWNPVTDYIANFVYENNQLQFILTSEGRIMKKNEGTYEYQYFLKDHLGNTRITMNQNGNVLQEDAYYPFGMNIAGLSSVNSSPENKYKYNGKELEGEFGLDWYDYGARFYDPQLARWHVIDRFAENHYNFNPCMYAYNNPLRFIDPDGNDGLDKVAGVLIGTADNLFGTNLRANYPPTDASDYNNALNLADAASLVGGAYIAAEGAINIGVGLVLAPETGVSLVLSAEGVVQTAVGTYMAANGAKNLGKNNYGEDKTNSSGTTEEVKTRKDPGSDGAKSEHIIEKDADGNTVSKTHRVTGKDGEVKHQHQDHVSTQKNPETGKKTTRQFPDKWVKYPKIDKK